MEPSGTPKAAMAALFVDYLRWMIPGPSMAQFIEASLDPEVQGTHLAVCIEANPFYAHYLERLDILQGKIDKWRQDFPEERGTERITRYVVTLLGRQIIRNAIFSIWVSRHGGKGLPRREGDPFFIQPRTQLNFALAAWDYCEEQGIREMDRGYFAGLCFDWVSSVMQRQGGAARAEKKYLDECWTEGLKAARMAHELAAIPKDLALSQQAFSGVLLIYLSKVLMAISFPTAQGKNWMNWKEFLKHCDTHGPRRELAQLVLEKGLFPFSHAEVASLCVAIFPLFRSAEKSVRYYQEPYVLKSEDPKSYKLASILSAALTLSAFGTGDVLSSTQKAGLAAAGIEDADILTALARANKKGKG